MTQYSSLHVKLSNSQLNKLKSSIKNETAVGLRISIDKLQILAKLLLKIHQLILNYQKLNYQK